MSGFAVDHVVLRVPDPDAVAARMAEATGLPVLRGWTPSGVVRSRGVRFANGPFLDIHAAPEPQPAWLGLRGSIAEAQVLALHHHWSTRGAAPDAPYPWRILLFRRAQGALTATFVIDYDRASPLWRTEAFSGELFDPSRAGEGPNLVRLTVAAPDVTPNPAALLPRCVAIAPGPAPEVVRLEIDRLRGQPVALTPTLTLVAA